MSEPFIAEIRMFPYTFAPEGWAYCQGQLMQIAQNQALFSLIGTVYGGNGSTTFRLPNLSEKAPMHFGSGPGLTLRPLGTTDGSDSVTLVEKNLPTHTHTMVTELEVSENNTPTGNVLGILQDADKFGKRLYIPPDQSTGSEKAASDCLAPAGAGQSHENRQPLLAVPFFIALTGIYPSRP